MYSKAVRRSAEAIAADNGVVHGKEAPEAREQACHGPKAHVNSHTVTASDDNDKQHITHSTRHKAHSTALNNQLLASQQAASMHSIAERYMLQ